MSYIPDEALQEMPKKPPSSFMKFRQHRLEEVKIRYPEKGILEQSVVLGEMWRSLSEKERLQYKSDAEEELSLYSQLYAQWLKKYSLKDKTVQESMKVIKRKERTIRERALKDQLKGNKAKQEEMKEQKQPNKQIMKELKETIKVTEIAKKEEVIYQPLPEQVPENQNRYARKSAPITMNYGSTSEASDSQ